MEHYKCSGLMSFLKFYFVYHILSLWLLMAFLVLRILRSLPLLKRIIPRLMKMVSTIELKEETYWTSIFSWPMYLGVRNTMILDLQKKIRLKHKAPDLQLVSLNGEYSCNLYDMIKGNRPLIVNFGSCTCPVFRKRLEEFTQMVKRFGDIADFLVVYIEEAHPSDGWAFKQNFVIPRHQTQEDRCRAAQQLQQNFHIPCPLLVDTMNDEAKTIYGAFPIRLCIIQDKKMIYSGGMGPIFYRLVDVRNYLENLKQTLDKFSRKIPVMNLFLAADRNRNSSRAN